ncbi:hypothetical protein [Glutamicibacter sp.]|nr:hypothetical protein [Glutamicibacter sp.]
MEYEEKDSRDGVPIRTLVGDDYRTRSACGGDYEPNISFGSD